MAIFLLVTALAAATLACWQTFRWQGQARQRSQAASLARNRLETLRAWAADDTHFRSSWSAVTSPVQQGDFQLTFTLDNPVPRLFSPASRPEQLNPDPRLLPGCWRTGHLQVSWPGDAGGLALAAAFPAPRRTPGSVEITRLTSGPVSPGAYTDFRVRLTDNSGADIPGACFNWQLLPGTGNGTLKALTRDGRSARLTHVVTRYGVSRYLAGTVQALAQTRYWGRVLEGESDLVSLQ